MPSYFLRILTAVCLSTAGAWAQNDDAKPATEITCTGEASFDAQTNTAVFLKDVKVTDQQFTLIANKLTVHFKKIEKEAESTKPSVGGMECVVAEGHVVITQEKVDEKTGEKTRYVGRAAKAVYDAEKGTITLSGWPQIQQGLNTQVATAEETIMVLDRAGRMHTKGPSQTMIKSEPAKKP